MHLRPIQFVIFLSGIIWTLCGVVSAETKMEVDAGWGLMPRSDRWTPVFVTVSDPNPRNVMLSIDWPVGGGYSMRIRQAMTLGATARTFSLLVPVHGWAYQQATFTLSDSDTEKTLAHFPKEPDSPAQLFDSGYSDPAAPFVGMSGTQNQLVSFTTAMGNQNSGYLPPRRLPALPLGYDALDMLILNAPNLGHSSFGSTALTDEQQQAIVDWVRAGGKLILWPGDGGFPASGPLVDVLPAKVGVADNITLSSADRTAIGLPTRSTTLAVHGLTPRAGAEALPMFIAGHTSAYATRLGLGRIVLSPVDIGQMQISDFAHCRSLWTPLLKNMVVLPPESAATDTTAPVPMPNYGFGNNGMDSDDSMTSIRIANFLGDVPGAGWIGFSYIAYVLIGLMLVVGPVDWLVLKKLGRQPWTWVTTSGWIVLVTTGAIFAGYLFKSGDLHYRTLRTIDQVGDATVAGTDYVALYSSRTRVYQIKTDRDGWWQPGAINSAGGSGPKLEDVDFHQTENGNTPEDMVLNVWSLRFLRGDHVGAGPPMISADLHYASGHAGDGQGTAQIVGTITNLTDRPLKNVRVEIREGTALCEISAAAPSASTPTTQSTAGTIPPHATVRIAATPMLSVNPPPVGPPDWRYRSSQAVEPTTEADLWKAAADLNHRRGKIMADQLATGQSAIVYAETVDPVSTTELLHQQAIEKHYQFIRALVDLHEGSGQ